MYSLYRQSTITLSLAALVWAALNGAIAMAPNIRDTVNTRNYQANLTHNSQLAHLIEEMHLLSKTTRPKLVFFGGSSAEYAFSVRDLEKVFPDFEVHGLCLNGVYGGIVPIETYEVLKAAVACIRPEARRKSVIVFGTLPHLFFHSDAPNKRHFTPARIRLFPRLYRMRGTEAVPRFGTAVTLYLHRLIRPFWILRRMYDVSAESKNIGTGIAWLLGRSNHTLAGLMTFDEPDDPRRRAEIERHASSLLSLLNLNYDPDKLSPVNAMLEFADENKMGFVIIALPLAKKLRDEASASFRVEMENMVARHNRSGRVHFLDHSAALPEPLMNDMYHVRKSATKDYAEIVRKTWPFPQ